MDKHYISITTTRTPRPRSERLREQGSGSVNSTVVLNAETGGSSSEGHTHNNKAALDQITTDENGYLLLTTTKEVEVTDPETGETHTEVQRVTEKVNAGYADKAGTLDEESPIFEQLDERYISKINDDTAAGEIGFLKGLWIAAKGLFGWDAQGNIKANDIEAAGDIDISGIAKADNIKSHNYTGDGIADTGWRITTDDGTGSSSAVFDYLTIRKKMIVNSLEIKETHFTAGDIAQSMASAEVARTDYFHIDQSGNYQRLGYSHYKVPWLLRGMAMVLGKGFVNNNPWVKGIFGHYKQVRITLTPEQLKQVDVVRCYFLAKDGEKEVENWWRTNDLARCQTWNVIRADRQTFTPDFNDHAGNIYWWRKVKDVSWNTGTPRYLTPNGTETTDPSQAYVNEGGIKRESSNGTYATRVDEAHAPKTVDGNTYHWFDVEYHYEAELDGLVHGWCDAHSDIPAAGDKVVQFGNSTDPDRMNITLSEINGSGNIDAPDIKMLRGVYTFTLEKSWWGGSPCKMKLSPATGYDFYGPHFRFVTEVGESQVPIDRPEKYWTSIALERDDDSSTKALSSYPDYSDDIKNADGTFKSRVDGKVKNYVRKCRYYDRVSHEGSLWLCSIANDGWHWIATEAFDTYQAGDRVTNYQYLSDEKKALCEHVRNYTYDEPTASSADWTQQVDKGDPGAFKSRAFCRTNTDISTYKPQGGTNANPVPTSTKDAGGQTVSGITWTDGAPDGEAMLWSTSAWFYSDGTHSDWTPPCRETDTQTGDIEFSPNYQQPAAPYGDDASKKDSDAYKTQRHSQGWYDPNDTLPSGISWSNMIWRAERQIRNGEYSGAWAITRIKGESSIRLDIDNELDMVQTDSALKITTSRNVETIVRLWDGAQEIDISNVAMTVSGLTATQSAEGSGGKGRKLSFAFTAGNAMNAAYEVTISYTYSHDGTTTPLSAVFTIIASKGQPVYQLKPSLSALPCTRNNDNTLSNPPALSLKVVKVDGSSTTEKDATNANLTAYGLTVIYSTVSMPTSKTPDATHLAWPNANSVQVANTDTDLFIALFNSDGVMLDRETIPVVKDGKHGENTIRLALDNEHEDFLYNEAGTLISPLGGASSRIRLYDGVNEATPDALKVYDDYSGSWVDSTGQYASADAYIYNSYLYVSGLRADSVKVRVRAEYNSKYYYAEFTSNKTAQDKYDLIVNPNAIAYNKSEAWTDKTIAISAKRTDLQGNQSDVTISTGTTGYMRLFMGYVKSDGKIYKPSAPTTEGMDRFKAVSKTVTSDEANAYIGIYFELRRYNNSSSADSSTDYRLCDYETVEIAKAENGAKGEDAAIASVTPAQITVLCDKNGYTLATADTVLSFSLKAGSHAISNITIEATSLPTGVSYNASSKKLSITTGTAASALKDGATFTLSGTYDSKSYSAACNVALICAVKGDTGVGEPGHAGRWYYYAGEWESGTYSMEETQAPFVMRNCMINGVTADYFFMLDFGTQGIDTGSTSLDPKDHHNDTSGSGTEPWTLMASTQQYYIAKAFFGDYAQFGSFIINGDWMMSTDGWITKVKNTTVTNTTDSYYYGQILSYTAVRTGTHYFRINAKVSGGQLRVKLYNSSQTELDYGYLSLAIEEITLSANLVAGTTYRICAYKSDTSVSAEVELLSMAAPDGYLLFSESDPLAETVGHFAPNFAVDGKTGKTYQNEGVFRGNLSGVSGTFKDLSCEIIDDGKLEVTTTKNSMQSYTWYGMAVTATINGSEGDLLTIGGRRGWSDASHGRIAIQGVNSNAVATSITEITPSSFEIYRFQSNGIKQPNPCIEIASASSYTTRLQMRADGASGQAVTINLDGQNGQVQSASIAGLSDAPVAMPRNIIIGSGTQNLPSNPTSGMFVFAKGTSGDMTIGGNGKNIMASNSGSTVTSLAIGRGSHIFLYDGTQWLHFDCS